MIHSSLQHIVGQENAKNLLSLSISSVGHNGDLIQPLLFGEAGLGKTEIARAYGNAIAEELGVSMQEFASPNDFRLIKDFDPILDILSNEKKYVLYIDECHELDLKMVSHAKFLVFLRKALDRQNDGKLLQVGDTVLTFNRKNQVIILSTNHPNKVDAALQSRMNIINLVNYNMKEMKEITRYILSKNNLECDCEQTLDRIAACGRGTARPITNLVQDVFNLMNITTVTNEFAMKALQMKEMYPAGLKIAEIKVLELCSNKQYNRMQIISAISNLQGCFGESIAYLIQRGLLTAESNGYKTTEKGNKYITYITREGFSW